MGTKWTREQKTVIDIRNCNILVSAAAGSGKTAVLVERILSLLMDREHPAEIDRMLIVTFTNAAAGEMRDRIRQRLEEAAETEQDAQMAEHLQRQNALLQNAQISTIHSFCQYVIRNYFHTIDLDPDFRIADEGEQKLLQSDVLTQLLEEKYGEKSEEFQRMVECIATGKDDRILEETILQLYHFSMSFPWPQEWLQSCLKSYEAETMEEFLAMPWIGELMKVVQVQIQDIAASIQKALTLCMKQDGPYMYEDAITSDQMELSLLEDCWDYAEFCQKIHNMEKWKTLSSKRDTTVSEELKVQVKELREEYKKNLSRIRDLYFFASPDYLFEQMKACRPMMEQLLDLTCLFSLRYQEEKQRRNLCDFHDLEHLALEILTQRRDGETLRTQVAEELSDYFEQIMIDEYQDSNLVQEMILTSISGESRGVHNLFMVGDVKQSIYRFRLARPELFMEKYASYSLIAGDNRRIDLHKNFRSRSQVLDSVNDLFEKIMAADLGKVSYDEAARLYVGAEFEENPKQNYDTEMLILDLQTQEDAEETERELEARMIGKKILELMDTQQVWDKEQQAYRSLRFGDIVILLRTISGWAEEFAQILGNMGIPCFAGARNGYFSAPEVQTILALLKIMDNPCQDIPLAAVLDSPIGGCTPAQLSQMRGEEKEKPFYQVCQEREELKDFFDMLNRFREKAVYTPMQDLLWEIFDETGYLDYVSAMPAGKQRRANLEMLVEKAGVYEEGSYHGLYHFIRYMENLHKYEVDFGEATVGTEETHMVRIMSIHKSKGLEFPVVFAAGLGKNMNQMDALSSFVTHMDLGIGCNFVDPVLRISQNTLFKNFIKMQIRNENLGEELRVLYVALTRAKEKLIMTGAVENLEKRLQKWESRLGEEQEVLSYTDRVQARCNLDWIMPVLLRESGADTAKLSFCQIADLLDEEEQRQMEHLEKEEELLAVPLQEVFDEHVRQKLQEQLSFSYPYKETARIPSKVSVSEVKRMHRKEAEAQYLYEERKQEEVQGEETAAQSAIVPGFLQEETTMTGAARGTVYHKIMEKIRLDREVTSELAGMLKKGILTEEEWEVVNPEKLIRFQNSALGQRMAAAQKAGSLFREQQFVMEASAAEVNPEWDPKEKLLIQGIIDAYFMEEGQIVLVDYKTDFVKIKDASSLYEKYKVQLDCYKKALELLTGYPVKEEILYSFCLDRQLTGSE